MENNKSACRVLHICKIQNDPFRSYAYHGSHCSCAVEDPLGFCIHRSRDTDTGLITCGNQDAWPDVYGNTTEEAKNLAKLVDQGLINFERENN